jgi:hypothetical protein
VTKIDPGANEQQDRVQVLDDEKKRALDLYTMNLVPPDGVLIFDEPTRCYRVNKQWAAYVMGMVSWLAEIAPWRDAQDESYFAIEQIQKFLAGVECMAFGLRQKPDDSCIMQQTLDGVTWTDVFDFSQCVTIQDKSYQISIQNQVTNATQTFVDIYNNYTTNYAGLPSDVHPILAEPSPGTDNSALKAALCNAIWELVRTACNAAVSFYTESFNQSQQEFNFLLAIAGFTFTALALAAAIPTAGASLVALGGSAALIAAGVGLGAGLGNYLLDFWQQHTIDQFQDTEAQEDVVCFLMDSLDGSDYSLADFKNSLAATTGDPNGQAILDFLEILFEHDSTYAAFLEKWKNNKQYADAGIDLYCPCANQYRVWTWDFSNGLGPFAFKTGSGGVVLGQLVDGRLKGTLNLTGTVKAIRVALDDFDPTWRVRSIKMFHEQTGATVNANNSYNARLRPTPDSNTGASTPFAGSGTTSGEIVRCWTDSPIGAYDDGTNQAYFEVGCDNSNECYMDRIEIMFEADYAPGGYITDDDDLCT